MLDKIRELHQKAKQLPEGFAKADLHREAVRLADLSQEKVYQFHTRVALVSSANFAGLEEESVVTFTWLLNHLDDYPEDYEQRLLWKYKWILGSIIDFSEFSLEQIDYFFSDARSRYQKYSGYSTRAIDNIEIGLMIQQGHVGLATELLESVLSSPRDRISDCLACEKSGAAADWFQLGDIDRAINSHEQVISENLGCAEEPTRTWCRAAFYYILKGDEEKSEVAFKEGYPKISATDNLSVARSQFAMCTKLQVGKPEEAVAIFDTHLPPIHRTRLADPAFDFWQATRWMLEQLQEAGEQSIKLQTAHLLPVENKQGEIQISDLLPWVKGEMETIAQQFDTRNQTTQFAERIKSRFPFGGNYPL